jgi:hypothetical protein
MRGTCKLCLLEKDLQKSHLVPRSLYKKVRTSGQRNNDPLVLTAKSRRPSSHQLQDYLLCRDCEHLFNVNGENYVMRLALASGRLPLLDILDKITTPVQTNEWKSYSAADTPQIERDKLAYFALSVFWRASVHTWHNEDGSTVRIELGTRYNEEIRKYLLGQTLVPAHAHLKVNVCTDQVHQNMFFPPAANVKNKLRLFGFVACGIDFRFGIGKSVPGFLQRLSILKKPEQWITVYDCSKHQTWSLAPPAAD